MGLINISNTGVTTIGTKSFSLDNLVFKAPSNIKDIDNNLLLTGLGYGNYNDYIIIRDKVTVNEASVNAKADKAYVDNVFRNKANLTDVLLSDELDNIQTKEPIIIGPSLLDINATGTYTITNYVSNYIYEISSDIGTITYNGGNTFDLTSNSYDVTTLGNVYVKATEPGKIISNPTIKEVTVSNVNYVSDQLLSNTDYANNAVYNNEFQY